MIFVTVGTQLAFDRLIKAVDNWADSGTEKVIAQIGSSGFKPQNSESHSFLTPGKILQYMQDARIIIAHAGMGSILSAMQMQKPIIIMPRQASLHEHRNDHQLATAKRFMNTKGIYVAMDEMDLGRILQSIDSLVAGEGLGPDASDSLLNAVRTFIES